MSEQKTDVAGVYKVCEGVLINKDNDALRAYKNRKNKDMKLVQMEEELSIIRQDMEEIKMLLRGLVK